MRKSWDEYFLSIARDVAERSTCNRKQVGCVLVRDRAILSTGYAGSMPGMDHCIDVGCEIGPDGGCQRTIHSEVNAVAQAAKHGNRVDGATAYVTLSPCYNCFKMLVSAGIRRVVFDEAYRIPLNPEMVSKCGIQYEHVQLQSEAKNEYQQSEYQRRKANATADLIDAEGQRAAALFEAVGKHDPSVCPNCDHYKPIVGSCVGCRTATNVCADPDNFKPRKV